MTGKEIGKAHTKPQKYFVIFVLLPISFIIFVSGVSSVIKPGKPRPLSEYAVKAKEKKDKQKENERRIAEYERYKEDCLSSIDKYKILQGNARSLEEYNSYNFAIADAKANAKWWSEYIELLKR